MITVMHKLLSKNISLLEIQIIMHMLRNWLLKIMLHLSAAFEKLIIHSFITQKTYTL